MPAHGVRVAHRGFEAAGHLLQHFVARGMAPGVVDVLEAIDVDEEHGDAGLAPRGHGDRVFHPVQHQPAVRRVGEGIALRQLRHLAELEQRVLGDAFGMQRGQHEPLVRLQQLRRMRLVELVLHLCEIAPQPKQLRAHGDQLRVRRVWLAHEGLSASLLMGV